MESPLNDLLPVKLLYVKNCDTVIGSIPGVSIVPPRQETVEKKNHKHENSKKGSRATTQKTKHMRWMFI